MNTLSDRTARQSLQLLQFMLVLLLALASAGFAGHATAADTAGKRFAVVWRISGEVTAGAAGAAKPRKLHEGDPVFVGESVRAAASSEAVLKTDDAGWLAVRPGAVFVAERFAAEGRPSDEFALRIFVGALRMITGWVGRSNREGHRVLTPTATIGIRGTDHEPYVMTTELAESLAQTAGTYDKVNRGGTTLDAKGNRLDVDPGKVGFARSASAPRTRGLMTLLLPVLLDKVPAFYVPGQFDAELDQLSQTNDAEALRQMEERRKALPAQSTAESAASTSASTAAAPAPAERAAQAGAAAVAKQPDACGATRVARSWLAQFDASIAKRRSVAILRMMAPEFSVRATVRSQDGSSTTLDLGRDEFAQSTVAAMQGLTDFKQRRLSIEGHPLESGACGALQISSVVIEQGKRNGSPYRLESTESFVLEKRAGKWLATKAETTQR